MDRTEFLRHLKVSEDAFALAHNHGYEFVDLTCKTPRCKNKVSHYAIQRSPSKLARPEDDYKYFNCGWCGARGNWSHIATKPDVKAVKKEPVKVPNAKSSKA